MGLNGLIANNMGGNGKQLRPPGPAGDLPHARRSERICGPRADWLGFYRFDDHLAGHKIMAEAEAGSALAILHLSDGQGVIGGAAVVDDLDQVGARIRCGKRLRAGESGDGGVDQFKACRIIEVQVQVGIQNRGGDV